LSLQRQHCVRLCGYSYKYDTLEQTRLVSKKASTSLITGTMPPWPSAETTTWVRKTQFLLPQISGFLRVRAKLAPNTYRQQEASDERIARRTGFSITTRVVVILRISTVRKIRIGTPGEPKIHTYPVLFCFCFLCESLRALYLRLCMLACNRHPYIDPARYCYVVCNRNRC
jgi:hypothetical protein